MLQSLRTILASLGLLALAADVSGMTAALLGLFKAQF